MGFTRDSVAGGHLCVIWVDDLIDVYTWRDAFGLRIRTPNLDRFMARAARFTNAYATVPLCAPCRAEIATGISPFRSGLVDLNRFWRDVYRPEKAWQYDLRRAGWHTFTTGKVDSNYQPMPEAYRRILFHEEPAADDNGRRSGVKTYLDRGPGIKGVNHPDDDGSQDDRFYDFQVAQNAIDFLGRADPNRRHLIQLGFKHPHYNLITPDRFYAQYDPAQIRWPSIAHADDYHGPQPGFAVYEAAYIANGQWTPEKAGDEAWRQVVRAYFAAISHMDHELGRFLDALDASPLGPHTTTIFFSDNGFNLGTHDSFHKMSQWDSAAHIPLGIRHPAMTAGTEIATPVSLHNIPRTIMDLAGLPPRPDWTSGQSLLPLIDPSFGAYDRQWSPVTCVFGTLSVRPSTPGLEHLRYFRYPNGEEHVYDLVADPGETTNIAATAPLDTLRAELVKGALNLGLDLRGHENPADGVNAMMAVDGSVILAGGRGDNDYWAYGADAEKIVEDRDGGTDTLWYMAGPDDYVLHCPANVEKIRIATVVSRSEADGQTGKTIRIVAHPDSPIEFETSERVEIDLTGSHGDDVMIGPKHGGAVFRGGAGNDLMIAKAKQANRRHEFYGEAGNDTLHGGPGRDTLDGGTGDDVIYGYTGRNLIRGGHGNDVIHDGEGASTVDPGPGRNLVTLGPGDHEVIVGTGVTEIDAAPGAKRFRIAWGGVCVIRGWDAGQVYDLSGWPAPPEVTARGGGVWRLRLGLGIVEVTGVPAGVDLGGQVV
ncbi:sulfatase-like hydrolase/transferase [Roseicyclus persicicus]|uniref:Sulfatase-like hydrolase/transferase n=1 Tax=Roseicyclus persicicus TaxID=2650661 RepID=A0A7X6JY85_9RHOB|nr:sulfatase-like hydrolase/transferase [Roseibacterium persicicum]NKX43558.1 sulfatase-like hydrolase/transferase [Roseibacterium persicicum]